MKLDRIAVYWVHVPESEAPPPPTGGEIEMTDEVRTIFESSFLGEERGGPRRQPFHFNFGGPVRNNTARDRILALLDNPNHEIDTIGAAFASDLQEVIDDRIGDLLLAIGLGWADGRKRCVLWVFPSDTPIQLQSSHGRPTVREIKNAFTRKSKYRKAVYFEGPSTVTRSDFLRGELVDSTRQGKSRSVAQYWVERFLFGRIALSPAQGVRYLVRGIRKAQDSARTPDEITSVVAGYTRLMSGSIRNTTLTQFGGMFVGEAKRAYLGTIPRTIERDAVFDIESGEVRRHIKSTVYVLESGISVVFPFDDTIDSNDYITNTDEGRLLSVEGIIQAERID